MPTDTRYSLLDKFRSDDPIEVSHVSIDTIPPDNNPIFFTLRNYHPGVGPQYKVTIEIQGPAGQEYIKIVPVDDGNSQWNADVVNFLSQLQYVPVPEHMEVPGRGVALLLRKSLAGVVQIHDSGWYLAYSRICKTKIRQAGVNGKEVSEVILLWRHDAYPEYVATCWKW